jgi:hypothetical protein
MITRKNTTSNRLMVLACMAAIWACASLADAAILQVGPTRTYKTVEAAYRVASPGDIIEIDSGTYLTNQAWGIYYTSNLTFRGVGPTRPLFDARHAGCNQQGIFILYGNNTTVENIEFYNTRDTYYKNASGIRLIGAGLTVRNCYFHDCDDGILTGANAASDILIENCEFDHCGYQDPITGQGDPYGQSHNIYIGNVRSFTIRHSWTHNTLEGHNIKTRAKANYILYNRISDENGTASYEITVPNGGTTYVIGNVIQQGPNSQNSTIIDYASEGNSNPDKHLYVVNNTIVNERLAGPNYFVRNASWNSGAVILVQNNIFQYQPGDILVTGGGTITQANNWATLNASLRDAANLNYRLTPGSIGAIDAGTAVPAGLNDYVMTPISQYVHPYTTMPRPDDGAIDIGAYEYAPNQPPTVNAGPGASVYEGQAASLHATAADPDFDALTYTWAQPATPSIVLTGSTSPDAGFAAPTVSTLAEAALTFTVTVDDGNGGTASDSVNVRVYMLADANRDDMVDVVDLLTLVDAFGSLNGDPNYDPTCDFNNDNAVDVVDLLDLVGNFGRTLE